MKIEARNYFCTLLICIGFTFLDAVFGIAFYTFFLAVIRGVSNFLKALRNPDNAKLYYLKSATYILNFGVAILLCIYFSYQLQKDSAEVIFAVEKYHVDTNHGQKT